MRKMVESEQTEGEGGMAFFFFGFSRFTCNKVQYNLPLRGAFCQSRIQADWVEAFARRRANALDVLIGALQASCVASLASSSALQTGD
jgi:hypothetical protein